MEKEERHTKKTERKELKWALKAYKKEYHAWYKLQTPEIQKKLKKQRNKTSEFYKPYGKTCLNVVPGEYRPKRTKYRKNGIK